MKKLFWSVILSTALLMTATACEKKENPPKVPDGTEVVENGDNTEEPAEQPEEPAEQPEEPAEQPEEPAEQPEEPAEQPEEPTEQPEEPAEQPEKPAEQPEEPAEQPEEPAEQPEEPAEQPEKPAEQPEEPAEQPEEPAEQPEKPAETEEPAKEMTIQEVYQYNRSLAEAKALDLIENGTINADKSTVEPYPLMKEHTPDMSASNNSFLVPEKSLFINSAAARKYGVYIGLGDWYFYQDTIKDFEGTNLFTEAQLASKLKTFQKQYDYCKENGIEYYLTFAPNKNTIYPELMSEKYTMAETRRIDQLTDYIRANSEIPVIELRDALLEAKAAEPETDLYHRLDTHWNQHAGFVAVNELLNTIKEKFPAVSLLDKNNYRIDYFPTYMKDQAWYMGYYDTFIQEAPQYTPLNGYQAKLDYVDDTSYGEFSFSYVWPDGYHDGNYACKFSNESKADCPSVIMFRDSFAIPMIHFISESFSSAEIYWSDFTSAKVKDSGTDIVIVEIAERSLAS